MYLLEKFCVLCLFPAGWRRAIPTLEPLLALCYGQAAAACPPTRPVQQHSTAADKATDAPAARQLSATAKPAWICQHI